MEGSPIKYSLQWFLLKPSHEGFSNFFPTGTYAGIGTTGVEFENVMKSATKKYFENHILHSAFNFENITSQVKIPYCARKCPHSGLHWPILVLFCVFFMQ